MPDQTPDAKELGYYLTLSQVGLEMVAPLVVGAIIDSYTGWSPWALVVGAVLGFVGGLAHLIALANRHDKRRQKPPPGEAP
jgi:F0F1-type ATP synthase assembly protein I